MEQIFHYTVTKKEAGLCVSAFLRGRGISRRLLAKLKTGSRLILRNGEPARADLRLQAGDCLTVRLPQQEPSPRIVPAPVPLDILYEDRDLLVINKAARTPVHPSQNHSGDTVANGLAFLFAGRGETFVFRAVNRLDRDTTGLLLIAKNRLSGSLLASMAERKIIRREYLALAAGKTESSGTIRLPIARKEGSVIERCIDAERGEAACTHYRLIRYDPVCDCSLIRLVLETGRTHQIRVHMKAIGHPLLGDFLYNPDFGRIDRQALHSWRLSFPHPADGREMNFTAPVPEDFSFFPIPGAHPQC